MAENTTATMIYETSIDAESGRDSYVFQRVDLSRRLLRRADPVCALAVSSDERVQQNLAEAITGCGLIVFRAFTVGESRRILSRQEISLVVCDDRLIDGTYEDLLQAKKLSPTKPPVIVLSLLGDWPEYLKAINVGAFDFLAYPPIRGELPRVVRHALESRVPRGFGLPAEQSKMQGGERQ